MAKELKCSTCAAPLNLAGVTQPTVVCAYCGSTILLPEEVWGTPASNYASWTTAPQGSVLAQAASIAEIARLIRAGRKIEAIKRYRETFGVGLAEAKTAIERLEAGKPVSIGQATVNVSSSEIADKVLQAQSVARSVIRPILIFSGIIALIGVVIAVVAGVGGVAAVFSALKLEQQKTAGTQFQPATQPASTNVKPSPAPKRYPDAVFSFGSEGIGAGQFKDARSVAVDPAGRIYVGEYQGGRVQVFDSDGNFITQWMVDGTRALLNLSADRKGSIYVLHPGQMLRYDAGTGRLIEEVGRRTSGSRIGTYVGAAIALDGTLTAIDTYSNVVMIGADGEIKSAFNASEKVGERVSLEKIAVDGEGNYYALSRTGGWVLKFAADGRFITRFGGTGDGSGQLRSPDGIAVDGRARVYVSDDGIQVFDSNGRFLSKLGDGVIFGIAINDRNEIFATLRNEHKIVKYAAAG
jgi:ribosomal protein L7/L12